MNRVISCLPIGQGDERLFAAYMAQQRESAICAHMTLDAYPNEVMIWHQIIRLLRIALQGEHDFMKDGKNQDHVNLALRWEVVALSTSKTALECCIGGHFVQGSMMVRHLLETWQRIVYVQLRPQSAVKWTSLDGKRPQPPSQGTIANAIRKSKANRNQGVTVENAISSLDLMAHPSHAVLAIHNTSHEEHLSLGVAFHQRRTRELLQSGTVATLYLASTNLTLEAMPSTWVKEFFEISRAIHLLYEDLIVTDG